jgi:hypothetical protein
VPKVTEASSYTWNEYRGATLGATVSSAMIPRRTFGSLVASMMRSIWPAMSA